MTDSTTDQSTSILLSLPVQRVTLYEDRAEVFRAGTCEAPGPRKVVIGDVSPLTAADRTKVVAKSAATGKPVLVDDVRIEHVWVNETRADKTRITEIRDALVARQAELSRLERRLARNGETLARKIGNYDNWQTRTGWVAFAKPVDKEDWLTTSRAFEASILSSEEERRELTKKIMIATRDVDEMKTLAKEQLDTRRRLVANIVLHLSHATEPVSLEIASRIPCALWRPTHEAHLGPRAEPPASKEIPAIDSPDKPDAAAGPFDEHAPTDPGIGDNFAPIDFSSAENEMLEVEWTVKAALWQQTGEDWENVDVFLSTERPSKGAVLPTLIEDRLHTRQKTAEEKKTIQVEHRTESASTTAAVGVAPGVYDGGEARHFKVPVKVSLKSDGRPQQVAVRSFSTGVNVDRVAFPDASERVFRRAKLVNDLDIPLLAGPVSLRESGAFIGVGDLRYVGPLEKFAVSFGTDDGLVVRTRRYQAVESRRIAKDKTHFVTEITVLSARAQPTNIDVIVRWPVSELEQVKVEPSAAFTTGGVPNPDADGLVHLPVTIAASGRKMLQIGFAFDTASGVNLPPPW